MRTLLYHSNSRNTAPLQKVFADSGIYAESCHVIGHFFHLCMVEVYSAVIYMTNEPSCEILNLYQQWKAQGCKSLFIVITTNQSRLERIQCLQAGIELYFIEPYSYLSLIKDITHYEYIMKPALQDIYVTKYFKLDLLQRQVSVEGHKIALTKKEFALFSMLIRNRGIILTRVQVWEDIWGYKDYPLTNIIDVHINRLRKKLPPKYRHLLETVYSIGYRFDAEA